MKNYIMQIVNVLIPVLLIACANQQPPADQDTTVEAYLVVKFKSSDQVMSLQYPEQNQLSSENEEIAAVLKSVGAVRWEPLQRGKPKNEALAKKMGMDRVGRLYFKKGSNVDLVLREIMDSGLVEYVEKDQEAHTMEQKNQ